MLYQFMWECKFRFSVCFISLYESVSSGFRYALSVYESVSSGFRYALSVYMTV